MKKLNRQKLILELKKMRDLSLAARSQRSESCQKILRKQQSQERRIRIIVYER